MEEKTGIHKFFQNLVQWFVRPAFIRLVGEGSINAQYLRFSLALFIAPFGIIALTSVTFPNSDRVLAFLITFFVVVIFGVLGFLDQQRLYKNPQEHYLVIEVFESTQQLDRASDVEIIVRGVISDEKMSKDGQVTFPYGDHQVGKAVLLTARRDNTVSYTETAILQPNSTKINLSLNQVSVEEMQVSDYDRRKPPFFRTQKGKQ